MTSVGPEYLLKLALGFWLRDFEGLRSLGFPGQGQGGLKDVPWMLFGFCKLLLITALEGSKEPHH